MKIKFQLYYFLLFFLIFLTEFWIAFFSHNGFIRAYFGDYLVVILIYCFLCSFLELGMIPTALGVLILAYTIEISQYFHLIQILGLENRLWAHLILGSQFEWWDMVWYTLGILSVILFEKWKKAGFPALDSFWKKSKRL